MDEDEVTVEPGDGQVPGCDPRTPTDPRPPTEGVKPDETSPSPYADDFEAWVSDETTDEAEPRH